jgi:hypothetical protein
MYPDKKDEHSSDDRDGMAVCLVPKPYIVGMEPRRIGKCSRTCAVDGCNGEGSQSVGRKHGNTNDRAQAEQQSSTRKAEYKPCAAVASSTAMESVAGLRPTHAPVSK